MVFDCWCVFFFLCGCFVYVVCVLLCLVLACLLFVLCLIFVCCYFVLGVFGLGEGAVLVWGWSVVVFCDDFFVCVVFLFGGFSLCFCFCCVLWRVGLLCLSCDFGWVVCWGFSVFLGFLGFCGCFCLLWVVLLFVFVGGYFVWRF